MRQEQDEIIVSDDEMASNSAPPCLSGREGQKKSQRVLHFCFLIHGYMGTDREMEYLESSMETAAQESLNGQGSHTDECGGIDREGETHMQSVITYKPKCNVDRTTDGVVMGGDRLVEEILKFMKDRSEDAEEESCGEDDTGIVHHLTASFFGYSLGGLYARYVIAKLNALDDEDGGFYIPIFRGDGEPQDSKDGRKQRRRRQARIRVQFNVFCTMATPHLGLSRHTFIPIPRFVETPIAFYLGASGRDFFQFTPLLRDMALLPYYRDALRAFRVRILYANAFGTDFQVPTMTAAFLSLDSEYPHRLDFEAHKDVDESLRGVFVATMHTDPGRSINFVELGTGLDKVALDQLEMSVSLDSLGWKKVFVDTRELVSFSLRLPVGRDACDHLDAWRNCGGEGRDLTLGSMEVASVLSGSYNRINSPTGHTVMVANSKNDYASWANSNGRPLADRVAQEVVTSIATSWSDSNDS